MGDLVEDLEELWMAKYRSSFDCASCGVDANMINRIKDRLSSLEQDNKWLREALRGIATMDCYTREGEEPPHIVMMGIADAALGE